MNCVLFAKLDTVFSLKKENIKKYWKNGENSEKGQGILSVLKSGNHDLVSFLCQRNVQIDENSFVSNVTFTWYI